MKCYHRRYCGTVGTLDHIYSFRYYDGITSHSFLIMWSIIWNTIYLKPPMTLPCVNFHFDWLIHSWQRCVLLKGPSMKTQWDRCCRWHFFENSKKSGIRKSTRINWNSTKTKKHLFRFWKLVFSINDKEWRKEQPYRWGEF